MKNVFKRKMKNIEYKEKIEESDLKKFGDYFIQNNNLDYTESQPLFCESGLFNKKNYNSGVDLLLRNYLKRTYYSQKLESHYSYYKSDLFSLSVSIDNFNGKNVVIIFISVYNSDIKDTTNYIYHIEYYDHSRKIKKMYCNNNICTITNYLFLLNFIQKYALYAGFFGKIYVGYIFDLDYTKYSYSNTL